LADAVNINIVFPAERDYTVIVKRGVEYDP
jgi:hypothetical protein